MAPQRPTTNWIVLPEQAGTRLDKFLSAADRLGSRHKAADALARGKIFLNDREATPKDGGRRLEPADVVRVWVDRPGTARRPASLGSGRDLQIVYEDDSLLVLDKPPGVLAVPLRQRADARSVFGDVKRYLRDRGGRRPFIVHRIDRDTSGLVVFAKSAVVQERMKAQFMRRLPERVYLAVVHGHPAPASGTWRDRIVWDAKALRQRLAHPREAGGKDAICRYRVVEQLRATSLLEVTLVTGRRNQIRLQARMHGHMIVGERLYTDDRGMGTFRSIAFDRQALHAHRLVFVHPSDGRTMRFESPLPEDLSALLARLRQPSRQLHPDS